ncbi:serine hydrolase domain-containing protein [Nocardia sp. NPDC088792]|uniref:serine hydrolase domain-containing protein n=1 Tax=Nocardia sp. NPDC088792 TaxID=3364332 RepID=UPI003821B622
MPDSVLRFAVWKLRLRALFGVVAVSLLVGTTACGSGQHAGEKALDAALVQRIDGIVADHLAAGLIPGAVVAVVDPVAGTYIHAYGKADTATGRPAGVHDRFRIGSITKTFTATAVLRLVDDGKLRLDDPLERYVPGVPNGTVITIGNLLGMRGGVYDLAGENDFLTQSLAQTPGAQWHDGDRLRAIIAHPEKASQPDQHTVYSNSEYYLLGLVLEKVTGKPVGEVLQDLARQYGLDETTYPSDGAVPDLSVHGYAYDADTLTDVTQRVTPVLFGAAGSMISSVSDLARYGKALGTGELLKPETFQARTHFTDLGDGTVGYGLGLSRMNKWLGHDGAVLGYNSQLGYLPDRGVTVAVAINQFGPATTGALPVNAGLLWNDLVDALYPGTGLVETTPGTPADPPIPTAADLNNTLTEALRTDIPSARKALRITGDTTGDLMTAWSATNAAQSVRVQVQQVRLLRQGLLMATGTMTSTVPAMPLSIPFVPGDGGWQLPTFWVCESFVPGPDRPAACSS